MSTVSTEKMMAQIACKAIDDKKGQDIKIIDIHNVSVIADYIEPMRYKASRLPEIRKLAFEDLDECMYEILKDTLEYLEEDSADDIEPTSKEAYIYYKELHNKRNNVSDN